MTKKTSEKPRTSPQSPFERVRALAAKLPEVETSTSYRTAALKVRGKLLARMKEDDETLVLFVGFELKDALLEEDASVFFTTPHYDRTPAILIRLAAIDARRLARLLDEGYRFVAPKKLVAALDEKA